MLDTVGDDNIFMRTENKSTYYFNKDDKLLFHSNKIDIRPLKKLVKKNLGLDKNIGAIDCETFVVHRNLKLINIKFLWVMKS